MTRICMAGACGRMGRRILELATQAPQFSVSGAVDAPANAGTQITVAGVDGAPHTYTVTADMHAALASSDVLIDFSSAESASMNAKTAAMLGKPAVIGTTGLNEESKKELAACAALTAIIFAPNMSIGVNLLFRLVSEVASVLGLDYAVEIVETHHDQKKDSPSGTAVRLAERAAEALNLSYNEHVIHGRDGLIGARPRHEIGMHALRGGDVTGDHTVYFIGKGERIELTHRAHSRDTFAQGALRAATFAVSAAPGLYDMQDVLGLK